MVNRGVKNRQYRLINNFNDRLIRIYTREIQG